LKSEFLIFVLQANLSNQMICSDSDMVKAETFIGLRQPTLSIIRNFSGDAGIRSIPHLKFISKSYSTVKLRIICKIKLNIHLFTKSILLFSAVCLVCQIKRNLDNGTVINQLNCAQQTNKQWILISQIKI